MREIKDLPAAKTLRLEAHRYHTVHAAHGKGAPSTSEAEVKLYEAALELSRPIIDDLSVCALTAIAALREIVNYGSAEPDVPYHRSDAELFVQIAAKALATIGESAS